MTGVLWSTAAFAQDVDLDGVVDFADNCITPDFAHPDQCDSDADGFGDWCDPDYDGDGVVTGLDFGIFVTEFGELREPSTVADHDCNGTVDGADFNRFVARFGDAPGPSGLVCAGSIPCIESDGDGLPDHRDNCIRIANIAQLDADRDGYGNACDFDLDNDGVTSGADFAAFICATKGEGAAYSGADWNGDGLVDFRDAWRMEPYLPVVPDAPPGPSGVPTTDFVANTSLDDDDGDGILNYLDNCVAVASRSYVLSWDEDGDGFGRACDADYDEDGVVTSVDRDAFASVLAAGGYEAEMDHDGDGVLSRSDFETIRTQLAQGFPGPNGSLCPAAPPPDAFVTERALWVTRGGEVETEMPAGAPWDEFFFGGTTIPELGPGAECGSLSSCVTIDVAEGIVRFESDPEGTDLASRFEILSREPRGGSIGRVARFEVEAFDPDGGGYAPDDLSAHALVVYNENVATSATIAEYYRSARGLTPDQLCGVSMPPGFYATGVDLEGARAQILDGCLCRPSLLDGTPSACGTADPEETARHTLITHLVIIRGVPARLIDMGYRGDDEKPSLDPYLAYSLFNESNLFECVQDAASCQTTDFFPTTTGSLATGSLVSAVPFLVITEHDFAKHDGLPWGRYSLLPPSVDAATVRHLRGIVTARDRFVAYGRIEGTTAARAMKLIDDTLAAEAEGFRGNIVSEDPEVWERSLELTSAFDPRCRDYVDSSATWPSTICRAGTTYSNSEPNKAAVPGENGSEIPIAANVGLFLGKSAFDNPNAGVPANTPYAFDGFPVMTRWRRSEEACTPLCIDQPDPEVCAAATADPFGELDSSCVGGAPGMIGFQYRSYPVAYYGFYPSGWSAGESGDQDRTPPVVEIDGGATGSQYLHVGTSRVNAPDTSTCTRADGMVEPCPEHVALLLDKSFEYSPPLSLTSPRAFRVGFSYRSQTGGLFRIALRFRDAAGAYHSESADVPVGPAATWTTPDPVTLTVDSSKLADIDEILLRFHSTHAMGFKGFIDVDEIQLSEAELGDLIRADVAGFEVEDQQSTALGDYAANAIERLGAVGWWGSAGHYKTAGAAFAAATRMMQAFFTGRSLGESVALAGNLRSGLFYGDPLYRPSAAALYFVGAHRAKQFTDNGGPGPVYAPISSHSGQLVTSSNLRQFERLFVNAFHGSDNVSTTRWALATCTGPPGVPIRAEDCTFWAERPANTGSAKELAVDWSRTLIDPGVDQFVVIRLRVWNVGEEEHALTDYAYIDYRVNAL